MTISQEIKDLREDFNTRIQKCQALEDEFKVVATGLEKGTHPMSKHAGVEPGTAQKIEDSSPLLMLSTLGDTLLSALEERDEVELADSQNLIENAGRIIEKLRDIQKQITTQLDIFGMLSNCLEEREGEGETDQPETEQPNPAFAAARARMSGDLADPSEN